MRAFLKGLMWLSAGVLAAVVALEGTLRLLPVARGLARTEQLDRWPLQGYQPHQPYTYSTSWQMLNVQHGITNNYGHVAPFDYQKGSRPVIVVGDSYVESLMNPYAWTVQAQLGELVGSRESVYGLGFSGLSAADYLALSKLAREELAPRAAVFVIFNGDFSESLLARRSYYHFEPDGDAFRLAYRPVSRDRQFKTLREYVTAQSLYRYVFANLKLDFGSMFKFRRPTEQREAPRAATGADAGLQRRVIDHFLAQLPGALGLPPRCIVFLVDSDRYAIYNPARASEPKEALGVRSYFLARASERGFAVTDLDPVFRARYSQDHARFDYFPNDRHWNRLGHGIAAQEAYRLLTGGGNAACIAPAGGTQASRH